MKGKQTAVLLLAAAVMLFSSCVHVTSSPIDQAELNSDTVVFSADGQPIDFGIYCDRTIAQELVPQKPLEEYRGTMGVIVSSMRFPYGGGTKVMAEDTLKKYFPNMDFVIGNGDGDPVTQSAIIDDYIAKGIDVLIIDPVEKEAMVPAFERLKDAGIPVICVDRYVPAEYESVVKADDVKIGKKAGEAMVKLLGGSGKVVEIQGAPAASNTNDRHIGFAQGIEGSDIEVIAAPYADFLQTRGLGEMEDLLQRFPNDDDIDAIFSQSDVMTMGIIQALKAAGRNIPIVSIDAQESALDAVSAGYIGAVVAYPIPMPAGIFAGVKVMNGEDIPDYIELECPVITKSNVEEYKGHSGY